VAQRGWGETQLYSSMTTALEGSKWSAARPGRTLPLGKARCPFYRRRGGPQGRSGRGENLVHTGIRSRTVQPVAQSLYRLRCPAHDGKSAHSLQQFFSLNSFLTKSTVFQLQITVIVVGCEHSYDYIKCITSFQF